MRQIRKWQSCKKWEARCCLYQFSSPFPVYQAGKGEIRFAEGNCLRLFSAGYNPSLRAKNNDRIPHCATGRRTSKELSSSTNTGFDIPSWLIRIECFPRISGNRDSIIHPLLLEQFLNKLFSRALELLNKIWKHGSLFFNGNLVTTVHRDSSVCVLQLFTWLKADTANIIRVDEFVSRIMMAFHRSTRCLINNQLASRCLTKWILIVVHLFTVGTAFNTLLIRSINHIFGFNRAK